MHLSIGHIKCAIKYKCVVTIQWTPVSVNVQFIILIARKAGTIFILCDNWLKFTRDVPATASSWCRV